MKKTGTIIITFILVGLLTAPVFAYRGGWGKGGGFGPGSCWSGNGRPDTLTEEQRAALNKLENTFFDETSTMRRELWSKADELDAVLRGVNPDAKKVKALQKEVSALRTQMAEKRTNFILEAKKITPDADFGRGYGRGPGSCRQGYGERRGGSGPGACWK